jgi:hypothetical protein
MIPRIRMTPPTTPPTMPPISAPFPLDAVETILALAVALLDEETVGTRKDVMVDAETVPEAGNTVFVSVGGAPKVATLSSVPVVYEAKLVGTVILGRVN